MAAGSLVALNASQVTVVCNDKRRDPRHGTSDPRFYAGGDYDGLYTTYAAAAKYHVRVRTRSGRLVLAPIATQRRGSRTHSFSAAEVSACLVSPRGQDPYSIETTDVAFLPDRGHLLVTSAGRRLRATQRGRNWHGLPAVTGGCLALL